ncbi:MAG: helix-turn-helix transcriptional regulator [Atribacterota bacterium]|nr:helix-turn-helix transcriptional regulator [Atribacterota bacterium]
MSIGAYVNSYKKNNPELEKYIPLVKTIAEMFGKKCEVLIHDFSNPQHSIAVIENGHVTGRKIGAPITDLALSIWKKGGYENKNADRVVNYKTKSKDGKILKSSTVFIRDNQKKIIGCICINYDLTEHSMFHKVMDEFCTTVDLDKEKSEKEIETFTSDVNEVLKNIIQEAIEKIGKPVSLMQKEDKLMVAKIADEKGAFLIKGAITQLAKEINVSRFTIYNYLEEIKPSK